MFSSCGTVLRVNEVYISQNSRCQTGKWTFESAPVHCPIQRTIRLVTGDLQKSYEKKTKHGETDSISTGLSAYLCLLENLPPDISSCVYKNCGSMGAGGVSKPQRTQPLHTQRGADTCVHYAIAVLCRQDAIVQLHSRNSFGSEFIPDWVNFPRRSMKWFRVVVPGWGSSR